MPKTYKIEEKDVKIISEARKKNTNKKIEKRLYAVQLRGEGKSNKEIAEKLDSSAKMISQWVSEYINKGIEYMLRNNYGGNHRNMSYNEEKEILSDFEKESKEGKIVKVSEIEKAYVKKLGRNVASNQIYLVLKRHGWSKKMPRSRHPKKADEEAIEASKKLKIKSQMNLTN